MNTRSTRSLFAAAAVLLLFALLVSPSVFAQADATAASDPSAVIAPETAAAVATPFIVTAASRYPWILTVLAVMGGLRFFFKPIVSLVEARVRSTPQKRDDEYFDQVSHSRAFKAIAWALDFFASVKVGPQFTAAPEKK